MKFDVNLAPTSLSDVPRLARSAEQVGFDAVWTSETEHDPFLPLALVAEHTQELRFGTAIAVAFARSPGDLAYTAWDLAAASGGRFILGLGTQVRPHIERRFGMPWPDSPVGKLREMVQAMRSIWSTWQEDQDLNFRGEYYKLTLMTPFFNPGPIPSPEIPIYVAGVNTGLCRLAGEVADGLHGHPLHTVRYLRETIRPALDAGAERAERDPGEVALSVTAFVVTSEEEAEQVRSQIAFYASTPSYRPVLELHGWGEAAERLSSLARRGKWDEMPAVINDDMLSEFAVVAEPEDLGAALREKYDGLVDRLNLYLPFTGERSEAFWQRIAAQLRGEAQ
ncbi:MAG: TIGR03617 family F420-dependent LLM class oxidoreductase [Anaerolineales bacterium]|nr:TIGR03617 family F420-dependent LLM class oxidoreductase [Anaerolineales bacterium]